MVGQRGFEPLTSRLSGGRSNQLSYWPVFPGCNRIVGEGMTLPYFYYCAVKALFLIVLTLVSPQPEDRFDYEYLTNRSWSRFILWKGGGPAAGSPTATLLRLSPDHRARRGRQTPEG